MHHHQRGAYGARRGVALSLAVVATATMVMATAATATPQLSRAATSVETSVANATTTTVVTRKTSGHQTREEGLDRQRQATTRLTFGHSAQDWTSRTIYQVLTDRYNNPSASGGSCDLSSYCGGTFRGLADKLDYITGMGFDAIWISPVVDNTPGGYHGYWARDLTKLNSNFGTEDDLHYLVRQAHAVNMWVMVDVVQNHMGNDPDGVTGSGFNPFDQQEHYHDCNGCPGNCQISDWNNQAEVEHCKLAGLPDLNQSNPFVTQQLMAYNQRLIQSYGFDGMRADTVPEVNKDFWTKFQANVDMYVVGEVFNGDVGYVSGYQDVVDGVLSYPLFFTMRNVFAQGQSMNQLQSMLQSYSGAFKSLDLLGTFIDNHDNARFLSVNGDHVAYKAALLFTLYTQGIPIIYYGSEQGYAGGNDPNNREALWSSGFNTASDLYTFLATAVGYRKKAQVWASPQVQRYSDDSFYAFTRGDTFVATTNVGSSGATQTRTITYHSYAEGTKLCNIFWPTKDCVTVTNKQFDVTLNQGECKVYAPSS